MVGFVGGPELKPSFILRLSLFIKNLIFRGNCHFFIYSKHHFAGSDENPNNFHRESQMEIILLS
uniref:Uncharacterized protein n=1 Tax=Picea glauca TaxID=3330 RepID=A0A101LUB9_PICGL|nr:hypothetical protein ABT39_MTgene2607 [Picea glauca]